MKSIASMGVHSLVDADQQLCNSDWHLSPTFNRPYFEDVKSVLTTHLDILNRATDMPKPLSIGAYWFQQYAQGDYHTWHMHPNCVFSNVYYVDLPDGGSRTTFKVNNNTFDVPVNEGQILTFPSCFVHCSMPNKVGTKTVIAFNI